MMILDFLNGGVSTRGAGQKGKTDAPTRKQKQI